MSDYLSNLTKRSLNQAEVIQPRLASMFEPLRSNLGLDATTNLGLEQPSVNAEAVNKNQMSSSRDIKSGDSLGFLPQEEVGSRDKFAENQIDMETEKVLSVHYEAVMMKPDKKVLEEGDNQGFSTTAETQAGTTFSVTNKSSGKLLPIPLDAIAPGTTFSVTNKSSGESELKKHRQTSTPNTHIDFQSDISCRLGASPDGTGETPMLRPSSSYEHTSGEQKNVDQPTPKVIQQLNTISSSRFTDTVEAIAGIAQPPEELSVKHSEQFQQGELFASILPSKPLVSNIDNLDNLIPLSTKPAINVHPHMQVSTSTNTTFSEPSPPTPTINVTIGRIEVRATPPTAPPTKQRPKPTVMGLEEYLHQRAKGDR